MISLMEATELAKEYLDNRFQNSDNPPVLVTEQTLETKNGWIFNYNSRKFIENKDEFARYVGNVPIAVLKKSGKIVIIPNFIDSIDDFLSSSPEGKE